MGFLKYPSPILALLRTLNHQKYEACEYSQQHKCDQNLRENHVFRLPAKFFGVVKNGEFSVHLIVGPPNVAVFQTPPFIYAPSPHGGFGRASDGLRERVRAPMVAPIRARDNVQPMLVG